MTLLIIAILCILDIAARTYITRDGICYEAPSGKKWVVRRKEAIVYGENEKRQGDRGAEARRKQV